MDLDNATAAYETAEASVAMSSADLDQAELELGYTIVRSPLAGHISERHVDLGTLVGPGGKSLLATIVKSDTVLVDFSMTALDYLKSKERNVNLGQKDSTRSWQPNVSITLADNTIYPYKGLVDFAEPQVDPRTGTFSVRAEMPNPERVLLPGQFTKVKLLLDVRESATVVPLKSVIIEKGGAYIYVMRKDSTVERRFIELGPEFQNQVVVERGLAPGEDIVIEGYHKLNPGMKVKVSPAVEDKNGGRRYDRIISLPNTNSPMEENLRIQKTIDIMKVSFFIDRPVFSAVISILIVIVGIIGLTMLPIDQYPQITPPVVKISASYPGASALTVSQAVATPIEQELNGTPGMLYMESNSSNSGGFSATVTFDISADPDLAAVEIQNRIKLAESRLPAEVIQMVFR